MSPSKRYPIISIWASVGLGEIKPSRRRLSRCPQLSQFLTFLSFMHSHQRRLDFSHVSYLLDRQEQLVQNGTNTTNTSSFTYNGAITNYLQDAASGAAVVLQEQSGSNVSSYMYELGSTTPLFQTNSQKTGGVWYHSDELGSVRALTDSSSGAVVNSYNFDAFGNTTAKTEGTTNSHLFAGEQQDATGLYFNRARYYNSTLGRFVSRDTFAGNSSNPTTLNRFIYGGDNGVLTIDPSGHFGCEHWDGASEGVSAGDCGGAGDGDGMVATSAESNADSSESNADSEAQVSQNSQMHEEIQKYLNDHNDQLQQTEDSEPANNYTKPDLNTTQIAPIGGGVSGTAGTDGDNLISKPSSVPQDPTQPITDVPDPTDTQSKKDNPNGCQIIRVSIGDKEGLDG
jgi:RHS repeat-associated protein